MAAQPLPKVHLIRTSDFAIEDYNSLLDFLNDIYKKEKKGSSIFVKNESHLSIPKKNVTQVKLNPAEIEHLISSPYFGYLFEDEKKIEGIRKTAKDKIQKITKWDTLFQVCSDYRSVHKKEVKENDLVILLTSTGNKEGYFSALDDVNIKNGFIHTDLWDFFLPGYNKIFPIAYEIIELIVHSNMGYSYTEIIEKIAHKKTSIGCISDMCNNKTDINIKLRTGDICEICLEKLKNHVIFEDVYLLLKFLDVIRNETLRTQRYLNINKKISNIKLVTLKNKKTEIVFTEYNKKLTLNGPLQKAIYLYLLKNEEGIPTPNEDFGIMGLTPIIEIYKNEAKGSYAEPEIAISLIRRQFSSTKGGRPLIYSVISKINKTIKKCVIGTQPEEEYKIHTIIDKQTGFNTYKVIRNQSKLEEELIE